MLLRVQVASPKRVQFALPQQQMAAWGMVAGALVVNSPLPCIPQQNLATQQQRGGKFINTSTMHGNPRVNARLWSR
jgi:hypothetical protein